ncbi:MAG: MoaD/ThiS family protein, partial [Actinobacteria bacterium]|nr:MoaD/ThiS family protein [Actinomycetota bacterium]
MPVLRLFAAAREAAGEARVELQGPTVGEVLDQARARFGEPFTAVLARSRVWVNGHPSELSAALSEHDVVAVLPPVSGGADAAAATPVLPAPYEPAAEPPPPPAAPSSPPPPRPEPRARPEVEWSPPAPVRPPPAEPPVPPPAPAQPAPVVEQPSADDLLDRLAGLKPFPPGEPVVPEPPELDLGPLFPEFEEPVVPEPPELDLGPLFPEFEEPAADDPDSGQWDPGTGPNWTVGTVDPLLPPSGAEPAKEPERDLWSWPDAPSAGEPAEPSPFAPPAPLPDWDRRWDDPVVSAPAPAPEPKPEPEPAGPEPAGPEEHSGPSASATSLVEPTIRILGPERPPERSAGPERPPERSAGPERPPERSAGPERPPERSTGPAGLVPPT